MRVVTVSYPDEDTIEDITPITRDLTTRSHRPRSRNSDSRRNSEVRTSVAQPGLGEICEEEEEDMQDDLFSKSKQLHEVGESSGKDVFGFRTPRKGAGAMAQKVEEEMRRMPTPLAASRSNPATPLASKRGTPRTPLSQRNTTTTPVKVGTPGSATKTPTRGILKTPTGSKRPVEPDTPMSTRKRVKRTLIRIAESVETNHYSDSGSEEEDKEDGDEEDSDTENIGPIVRGPPSTPRTPVRKGRSAKGGRELNTANMADSYFQAQADRVLTSERTLSRLKTPRLSQDEVTRLLNGISNRYNTNIHELLLDHKVNFPKWMSLLHSGFSIVTYGLGSKKSLIHDFHEAYLADKDCVVVNGYFPSLTIKSVLSTITEEILGTETTFSSNTDHEAHILRSLEDELYLLVHNIDGPMLRNEKAQAILASLAAHPKVHLICSIDHINAPLIWDQFKLARFNFIWLDSTTFLPYIEEAASQTSLMVRASGGLQLASISHVLAALTPNAKRIFVLVARHQVESSEPHYPGIAFMELYTRCRTEFLVTSDLGLRAQLTEFRDHKLLKSKRGADGAEYLKIPMDKAALMAFLETIDEK